ncbi:alkaline phosphatase D family protein, partial [Streptomyces sp. NPDC006386]|uniref:alkaline phosphatase D family protein n=1 Tax=Streptomyces sp. NPDC006386 TaxID=3156762 RepID=UPI0033AD7973
GLGQQRVVVYWEVAMDEWFAFVEHRGVATAHPEYAHSVHVDVKGLMPDSQYYYRFRVGAWISPVGRTRTAPAEDSDTDGLRLAAVACQAYQDGYYTAHRHLAQEDVDVVFHLGDYLYEYAVDSAGGARRYTDRKLPDVFNRETTTLADYRLRYALYKSDPDLQAAHAQHPFVVTWAPEQGSLKRLTCPYHTWTYRLNGEYAGQLAGAPLMGKVDFDRAACRLPRYRLEVWNGLIMICADPEAPALGPQLDGLTDRLAPYRLADLVVAYTAGWENIPANWKVGLENGSENYHHMGSHAATLEPLLPGRDTVVDECDGRWFTMYTPFAADALAEAATTAEAAGDGAPGAVGTLIPGLGERELSGMTIAGVFPHLAMALLPDSVTFLRQIPTGPGTHDAHFTVLVPAEVRDKPGFDAYVAAARQQLETIQSEDLVAIRGVQRGLATDPGPSGGRFSHLERPLWQFQRYLADRLVDRTPVP